MWFRGLQAVARKTGVKSIYDLSATPFYLGGSGYQEGYIFPWVVSDLLHADPAHPARPVSMARCRSISLLWTAF